MQKARVVTFNTSCMNGTNCQRGIVSQIVKLVRIVLKEFRPQAAMAWTPY